MKNTIKISSSIVNVPAVQELMKEKQFLEQPAADKLPTITKVVFTKTTDNFELRRFANSPLVKIKGKNWQKVASTVKV